MERFHREVDITLLGLSGTDPFVGTTSAARGAMYVTHLGQAPIVADNEPRRFLTGAELRYAEHTFDIRIPCNATILRVLRKYPTGIGATAIRHNPVTSIIYEEYEVPHRVGVLHVPEYLSLHQDFGFKYVRNEEFWDQLIIGKTVGEGTVIARSPAVKADGLYGTGLNAKVAFMALPGTIEDGFVMSKSFLKRMRPTIYNKVVANCGRKAFLLNLYGDEKNYKPFPDVGDRIRSDGVVFALRDIDDTLSPADMTPRALRTVDHAFDRLVIGKPGARVVDIDVYHDNRTNPAYTPVGMDAQLRKYYDAMCAYYKDLLNDYNRMRGRRKDLGGMHITPELNQLLVEAQIYLPVPDNERKLNRMYRLEPLDEWRVELTYEAEMDPAEGFKFTDFHGGKGVNCKIEEDENMPVDENGNRAEVVIYGGSTIRRMNFGRLYEHYFNAAGRDLVHKLRVEGGLNPHLKPTSYQLNVAKQNQEYIDSCWDKLMRFYQIIVPLQYDMLVNDPDRARHVSAVLADGIYLYMPPNNPTHLRKSAEVLRASEFCPHYGPVEYTNAAGQRVKTVKPFLVADLGIMMLEKIGEDWSGVASVKTQQFGLPSKLNNQDKLSTPGREQPVRSMGESETRSYICTVGPAATNELLDQTNNPAAHRYGVEHLLKAQKPTNIDKLVDRNAIPYGGSRPVGLYQHLLECRGVRFVYKPGE